MTEATCMLAERLVRRPRAVFLAASFPPANRPGSPRTWNLATSLSRAGWDLTVVTVDPAQWLRVDDPEGVTARLRELGIRRIAVRNPLPALATGLLKPPRLLPSVVGRAVRKAALLARIEPDAGWVRAAEKSCTATLQRGDADVVLASVPPFGVAPLAMRVARRLRAPFVIDYRDLWTLNPMQATLGSARQVRREREVVSHAAAITTISPSAVRLLEENFGLRGKVHFLPNGFHPDDLRGIEATRFDHFAIVYAGAFYAPKRSADALFRALLRLEENGGIGRDWRFHYYGNQSSYVLSVARSVGLSADRVVCHGAVPRTEALAAVAGADLVTVITSVYADGSAADRGIVTGKIFEAIGLGRPMLVIAPRESDVETVVQTAGRGRVIQGTEIDAIAEYIGDVANGRAGVAIGNASAYDWTRLGTELSEILARAVLEEAAA